MSGEPLTRERVEEALTGEIPRRDDGYGCRICERTFPLRQNVGVHELTHRRAVGLAPPPPRGRVMAGGAPRMIVCGVDGCTDRIRSTSLRTHLRSARHGMSTAEASFAARERLTAVKAPEPDPPPAPVLSGNGAAPVKTTKAARAPVSCPECGRTVGRNNIHRHLTHRHGYAHRAASDAVAANTGRLPAVVERNGDASPLSDLSAVEAVAGILSAARTDRLLPTRLLPAVVGLIEHTDAVLTELRHMTEAER